jgi:hypothetical protein
MSKISRLGTFNLFWVPQSTYICRVQSSVWRLPKYCPPSPPPLNPASVSSSRANKGGGVHTRQGGRGRGVNILEAARHWIGLIQYNPSTLGPYKSPPRSNKWRPPHVCRCPQAGTAPNCIHLNTAMKISSTSQNTYLYEHHSVCPLSELGFPQPSLASECALPPDQRMGRAHSPPGKGVGESPFRRLEKKLSTLPSLCSTYYNFSQEESVF